MRKAIAMTALAALSFGSVYAVTAKVAADKTITAPSDTTKKKVKVKTDTSKVKKKVKMKADTVKAKVKVKARG